MGNSPSDLLIVIVGPTAVGKSDAAIRLAEKINGEIVSADSRQIYKYMDIGTAKPTPEQRRRVVHHLIDLIEPDETYDAARFKRDAENSIKEIRERGRLPLLVGGTGLYIRAAVDGLFAGPSADRKLRFRLQTEVKLKGAAYLHQRLAKVDPLAAKRIHPHDYIRLIRALEVYEKTGEPISSLQKEWDGEKKQNHLVMIGLGCERTEIYHRIEQRVEKFFQYGLVEEVKSLLERGFSPQLPALQTLGYKEVVGFLEGEYPLEEVKYLIKRNTRRYAKRQLIWFRKDGRIGWINRVGGESPESVVERMKFFLKLREV